MFAKIVLFSLLLTSPFAFASKDRGGGDEIGLEFVASLKSALQEIQEKSPSLYQKLAPLDLATVAENAKVIVTDENLVAESEKVEQSSVAVNEPAKNLIVINRARWKMLMSENLKRAIALHEVLSLKNLENTGMYSLSAEYLNLSGVELRGLRVNTGKISPKLLDIIVNVPGPIVIEASSITVEGEVSSRQKANWIYVLKVKQDKNGKILAGDGDVSLPTMYTVGREIILPAGLYRISYSGSEIFAELAAGEKKVLHLSRLSVPKVDGNYQVSAFLDFTNKTERDKKLLSIWAAGYPALNFGTYNDPYFLTAAHICRNRSILGAKQLKACRAWLGGNYKDLNGTAVRFDLANNTWDLLEFDFYFTRETHELTPKSNELPYAGQNRQEVSEGMHDGDFVALFPGTYALEFTNIAGQKNTEYGIKVK